MSDEIAVGVPIYSRAGALRQLLESVPSYVSTVYVAENGPPQDRDRPLYREPWPFELDVLRLGHDVGIGACRAALTEAVTEPFLWMGDNDMEFCRDDDLARLREILAAHDDLGGVSGWLIEGDVVRSGARDLRRVGDTIIKEGSDPDVVASPLPHARFDFIPQAGLFRTSAYETYDYDPKFETSEHADFFLGHADAGEWGFASTPVVQTHHHKQIDAEYRAGRGQHNPDAEWLRENWGVERTVPGATGDWAQLYDRSVAEEAFDVFRLATPPAVWLRVRRALKWAGVA